MARITYRHLLYSLAKWGAISLACVEEDKVKLFNAHGMPCGYCKADTIRAYKDKNHVDCAKCALKQRGVCGSDDAVYFKIENEGTSWAVKRKAAREVFKAILEDIPASMVPEKWKYDD